MLTTPPPKRIAMFQLRSGNTTEYLLSTIVHVFPQAGHVPSPSPALITVSRSRRPSKAPALFAFHPPKNMEITIDHLYVVCVFVVFSLRIPGPKQHIYLLQVQSPCALEGPPDSLEHQPTPQNEPPEITDRTFHADRLCFACLCFGVLGVLGVLRIPTSIIAVGATT